MLFMLTLAVIPEGKMQHMQSINIIVKVMSVLLYHVQFVHTYVDTFKHALILDIMLICIF